MKSDLERGRWALEVVADVCDEQRRMVGADNPILLRFQHCASRILASLGKHDEALPMLEHVYLRRVQALGGRHPETISALRDLALVNKRLDHNRAIRAYDFLLKEQAAVLGREHPDVLTTKEEIEDCLASKGDCNSALPCYRETRDERKQVEWRCTCCCVPIWTIACLCTCLGAWVWGIAYACLSAGVLMRGVVDFRNR